MTAFLPGDAVREIDIDRILRVDHAGEYGAMRIYEGQLAVLKKMRKRTAVVAHMAEQERVHLETFEKLMGDRRARPSALLPFWHVAGYVLGAGTALLGEKAAMACTVAVESVIDEHYASQEAQLSDGEGELRETIATFRAEEREHHDTALAEKAEEAPAYPLLVSAIRAGTKAAIWLAERV